MSLYLAGPITLDPDYVRKFASAAAALRYDGFDVINPVEVDDPDHAAEALDEPYGERYEELLARDLHIIEGEDVGAVVVLPGWEESKGAQREVAHAKKMGKPILRFPDLKVLYPGLEPFWKSYKAEPDQATLPTDSQSRKRVPLTTGVLDYFPAALAAIAEVSRAGNDKHNPGQPIHHARGKSSDHADCLVRHLFDRGGLDPEDGLRHSAKVAWRALALLQEELEEAGSPLARGAKVSST